jgi:hypothetical protein
VSVSETRRHRAVQAATVADRPVPRRVWLHPVLAPVLIAVAYLVVLVVHYPGWIAAQNANSDIAGSFTITEAIARGHTGPVVLSTQGNWVEIGWGLLTRGLPFHRLIWELSAPAATLLAVAVLAWTVHRLAGRAAALLSAAIVLAASPTAVLSFTSASFHNLTPLGAVLLDAYLLWLAGRDHSRGRVMLSVAAIGVVTGALLASDELLLVVGVVPFFLASLLVAFRTRGYRDAWPAVAVTITAILVSHVVGALMTARHYRLTTPPLRLGGPVGDRVQWLAAGLLRLGNGRSVGSHPTIMQPLVLAAAVVCVVAMLAVLRTCGRPVPRLLGEPDGVARALHVKFWGASLLLTWGAYVLTNVAAAPTDRYVVSTVLVVGALIPLYLHGRRSTWLVASATAIFCGAGLAAIGAGELRSLQPHESPLTRVARIEALVASHHLGAGYAGYWDAASLQWATHGRLAPVPLFFAPGRATPYFLYRVSAWYRPRPHKPSWLVVGPGDPAMPTTIPRDLPTPAHVYSLGNGVRVATWPFDIAADLGPAPG